MNVCSIVFVDGARVIISFDGGVEYTGNHLLIWGVNQFFSNLMKFYPAKMHGMMLPQNIVQSVGISMNW